MVYTNTLTAAQKDKKIPIIINRDGNVCFFCKQPFVEQIWDLQRVIDHANDNGGDGREENLLLSHKKCNEEKKINTDYKLLALKALEENIIRAPESLSESESERENHRYVDVDELKEGEINLTVNKLVKNELESKLPKENYEITISYIETMRGIHYLLQKETRGRGSEPTVRRSLDAHCSKYAPWVSEKQGRGNRIIRRRRLDEK